ncbi:MAG TPA: DsbA family protein [Sphingomicrobium sp.]|nr:DsbA family protein [Sphingomicrobium sp.]
MLPGGGAAQQPDQGTPIAEISKADFFEPGFAPVRGAKSSDLTIVYFFDYQCPACRKYHADVSRALAEDRRVRVIYRDTPIFGPNSEAAANAAIAAQFQGRHEAMHDALMSTPGPLDAAALRAAARKAGIDWERLQRDLKRYETEIELQVARNFELAVSTGIHGTPAFIVGDALANGALDYAGLKGEIADARKLAAKLPPKGASQSSDKNPNPDKPQDPGSDIATTAAPPPLPVGPALAAPAFHSSRRADATGMADPPHQDAGFGAMILWFVGAGVLVFIAASLARWRRSRMAARG